MSSGSADGSLTSADPASPGWLAELLDVLEHRRRVLVAGAAGLSLLGVLAAFLLPQFVPPRPLVGAAVGLAAALLAVAIAVAADSADLTVRGARHVRAAGGQLAAVLGADPTASAVASLAARIDARAAAGGRSWVAIAPASRGSGSVSPWADALGVALSDRDRRVVVIDLASGPTPGRPGVIEVVADELKLGEAVEFDPEHLLARLGPGADDVRALELLTGLVPRLPSDIEILVVALPRLGQPGALTAAGMLDRVLVVAETDVTPRVDLIASLDAVDATGTASEVVLIGGRDDRGPGPEPAPAAVPAEPAPRSAADPEPPLPADPAPRAGLDREPPVPAPGHAEPVTEPAPWPASEAQPEPEPPPEPAPASEPAPAPAPLGRTAHRTEEIEPVRVAPPGDMVALADDDAEQMRVAAALQTLAQEVWSRDVGRT